MIEKSFVPVPGRVSFAVEVKEAFAVPEPATDHKLFAVVIDGDGVGSIGLQFDGVGAHLAAKAARASKPSNPEAAAKASAQKGLLFSSGLITGEALVGILLAVPFAAAQSTDVLTIPGFEGISPFLGLAAFVGFIYWLYATSSKVKVSTS